MNIFSKKRAMISIEALIIMIALIVIAAISAAVILKNSGILSQRAVTVSEQSRERLITGIEIISFSGTANISAETINNMELLVRLRAGSLPIQLKNLKILYSSEDVSLSASLQHSTVIDGFADIDISSTNSSWKNISDIEENTLDSSTLNNEQIRFNPTTLNLEINLSYASNTVDPDDENSQNGVIATIALKNLSSASTDPVPLNIRDEPIEINGVVFGFVTITGNANVNNSLNGTTAIIHNFPKLNDNCNFNTLITEKRFCFENKIGNGDTTLSAGEIANLKFKLKPYNALPIETNYELQLLPKEGAIETLSAISPSTLVVQKVKLWG
ncbi:MAG: archaellin/type IV pilin N-terminal domain-containing protein [Candidatus Woesearchaeota archaeon]